MLRIDSVFAGSTSIPWGGDPFAEADKLFEHELRFIKVDSKSVVCETFEDLGHLLPVCVLFW